MKRLTVLALAVFAWQQALADTVTTVDLVRVKDGKIEETLYYYENNWAAHREKAMAAGYISGFRLLLDSTSKDAAELMLVTDYADREQHDAREENFATIMDAAGGLKLLNDIEPGAFREITDAWTFEAP